MAINLSKGQKIDLTKSNPALNNITVGLGWDEASQSGGGFLGGLFSAKPAAIDCDASVILLQNDRFVDKKDVVYFGQLKSTDGAIVHQGDNLTGAGDGDDEVIKVQLNGVNQKYNKMVFVVNIYQAHKRNQDFGMIRNAFIRIMDDSGMEIARYNLTDNYQGMTGLVAGELYRHGNEWKFAAVGSGMDVANLSDMLQRYK
ncbi:TerD family protein [Enterococcus sp. BWM-S5]|uniref:TerD family protein n=1 Tax=Enterococcus larvae TaxID=2794352 RepID=A0ABS4CHC2_9ENTE|nr:TerD family protein [Enterococcus larvae]MBP1046020.1 TerD family protein [Enterococcus larvae]